MTIKQNTYLNEKNWYSCSGINISLIQILCKLYLLAIHIIALLHEEQALKICYISPTLKSRNKCFRSNCIRQALNLIHEDMHSQEIKNWPDQSILLHTHIF